MNENNNTAKLLAAVIVLAIIGLVVFLAYSH